MAWKLGERFGIDPLKLLKEQLNEEFSEYKKKKQS
jgi:hypothetical protein